MSAYVDDETVELLREQQERQRFDRRGWKTAYRADVDVVFWRPGGSPEDPTIMVGALLAGNAVWPPCQ